MERASKLLLKSKLGSKVGGAETVAQAAWRAGVGKRLAEKTHAASFAEGTLRVYVEDRDWVAQLTPLKTQILGKMSKIGGELVRDVEFRVMPGRRGPVRETQAVRSEGDGIEDPLLRHVYEVSAKIARDRVRKQA
jgi:predicted nucleic acid-binding Zn ribbon protein